MKKLLLTTVSGVLLATGIGYGVHAQQNNLDSAMTIEKGKYVQASHTSMELDGLRKLPEYGVIQRFLKVAGNNIYVQTDNDDKRVINIKKGNHQGQLKSIYIKKTNRLKIIDTKKGLVFNEIISTGEVVNNTNDSNAPAEKETDHLTSLKEYETIASVVDINQFSNIFIAEDNAHKRVIVLKDGSHQVKALYFKQSNTLKLIDSQRGQLFYGQVR